MIVGGLSIFLYGIETGMEPVGKQFGHLVAESKSQWMIPGISFIIGFAVTVAEPDLLILGQQIEQTTDGILGSNLVVLSVAIGVGLMIALGVARLIRNFPFNKFFLIFYIGIFILAIF